MGPAGAGTASRLISACRAASRAQRQRAVAGNQLRERVAAAGAAIALLAPAVLLDQHRDVEAHQGPDVRGELTVAGGDQDDFMHGGHARAHMHDARIDLARLAVDPLQPRDLVLIGQRGDRIGRQVQAVARLRLPGADAPLASLDRDGARGARGLLQSRQDDLVGIGEAGLLAGERAHPDALLDARAAVLDDPVLERPRLLPRELEVEVGEVDGVRQDFAEDAIEAAVIEAARPAG